MQSSCKKRSTRNSTRGRDQQLSNACNRSTDRQSLSDKFQIGLGRFVDNVVFPSPDLFGSNIETETVNPGSMEQQLDSNELNQNISKDVVVNSSDDAIQSNALDIAQDNLNQEANVAANNNITIASKKSGCKTSKPNMTEKHREYVKSWRENPPPDEPRPMRFMEFVWHYVRNQPLSEMHESDTEDSFDRDIKKNGRKTRTSS